jgi:hypothetical protein
MQNSKPKATVSFECSAGGQLSKRVPAISWGHMQWCKPPELCYLPSISKGHISHIKWNEKMVPT